MATLHTHGSIFHADEVIGAALLIYLGEIADTSCIRRVNTVPEGLPAGDIVLDIGQKLGVDEAGVIHLDHHQDKAIPCAAVLVFRHFDARWTKPERKAVERFLDGVDRDDRGLAHYVKGQMTISDIVSSLNPIGEASEADRLDAFRAAVTTFLVLFRRLVAFQNLVESQSEVVATLVAKATPYVVSETFLPKLLRSLEGTITRHAIYPSLRGGWCLQAVSLPGTKTPLQPIPADAPGATFVHATGFIASFATCEDAVAAAETLAAIEILTPVISAPPVVAAPAAPTL